jgi:hypothetical protein
MTLYINFPLCTGPKVWGKKLASSLIDVCNIKNNKILEISSFLNGQFFFNLHLSAITINSSGSQCDDSWETNVRIRLAIAYIQLG